MALEHIIKSPRTLGKLQNGPLWKFAEGFCCWLLEQGFSRWTIREHFFRLIRLNRYLESKGWGIHQEISIRDVKASFEGYSRQCRKTGARDIDVRRVGYSVNRFLRYLHESGHLALSQKQDI